MPAPTELASQTMAIAGVVPTYNAANTDGHKVALVAGHMTYLHVKNVAAGGDCVIVMDFYTACSAGGTTIHDQSVTIADGAEKIIGPFGIGSAFKDVTGFINFTVSEATNVTIAVIKVPIQ